LDLAPALNYDLTHVEIVVHDFTVFTMKKSNLDSWQAAIKLVLAVTVTFTASSYSHSLLAMVAEPGFAPLLGSNFSTSSGNYI
jgi:hypothetical protein